MDTGMDTDMDTGTGTGIMMKTKENLLFGKKFLKNLALKSIK